GVQTCALPIFFHERLLGNLPGCRRGRKITPPLIRAESGGTVPPESDGEEVLVAIIVFHPPEEGCQGASAVQSLHCGIDAGCRVEDPQRFAVSRGGSVCRGKPFQGPILGGGSDHHFEKV